MLRFLASGQPISYVIVHKVDRLARNRADDVEINLAIQRAGARLISCTENIDETPSGILLHGIMSSIAEFYSRNLANEVSKGLSQKARGGGTITLAPIGYRNVRTTDALGRELRTVEIDPVAAELVRWAFQTYAGGDWSLTMLLAELTARGLTTRATPKRPARPLSLSGLHKLLSNPYYRGEVVYRGVRYPGQHPALIDTDTWERAQAVRVAHNSAGDRQRSHDHYLKGSVYCGACGSRLIITKIKNRHGTVYPYFVCSGRHRKTTTCSRQAILIDRVERAIEQAYATVSLSPGLADAVRQRLSSDLRQLNQDAEREHQRLRREQTQLEAEQASLLRAHYAGAVPLDLLKREQDRLADRLGHLQRRLAETTSQLDSVDANLTVCLRLLTNCQAAYGAAPDPIRRQLNQAFFTKLYVDEDGIRFDLAEPFGILLSAEKSVDHDATPQAAETAKPVTTTSRNRRFGHHPAQGLNKATLVELRGFEPLAPSMRTRCATGLRHSPQPDGKVTSRPTGSCTGQSA